MRQLTAAAIEKLRPGDVPRRIKDGATPGLALVVHPGGARVFQFRARGTDGKPKKIVLGPFDATRREINGEPVIGQPLTLAAARALAARLWRERALGANVFVKPEREAVGISFADAARRFIDEHAKRRTRRWRETATLLGIDPADTAKVIAGSLAQRWRNRALASIDADDVHRVIDEAVEKGVPGRGARAKGPSDARGRALGRTLSRMFTWARREKRLIKTDPIRDVHIPPAGTSRDRTLTHDEIKALWVAFDAAGEPAARVLKLLLLTGQRLNEIRRMWWDEIIVGNDGTWTLVLSRDRTKNKRAHKVPLATSAKALIETAPRVDKAEMVFSLDGKTPISLGTKQKRAVDKKARIAPWRVHDLRRTVETQMAEMGVSGDVRDAILNHAKPGMRAVYDRSERLPERRAALERWAQRVADIVAGREADNVVPMTARPA